MPSLLLFGATGMIGAPLARAIKIAHPTWHLTAYVRNSTVDEYLRSDLGVDTIIHGTFDEPKKISSLSAEHEIVINAASSFDPGLTSAIIQGLKQRSSSEKGTLVHLSGAGNFIDNGTTGKFNPEGKVWNDDNESDIRLINRNMLNGAADTLILEAGEEGAIMTHIICPTVVYGPRSGPYPSLGVGYWLLTSNARQLGFVPYIGDGSSVVSTVHVGDVVPFIARIVDTAVSGKSEGSAYSRYYILHGETITWKELSAELAKVLHKAGVIASPEPKSVTMERAGDGELPKLIGANMLVKGDRAARQGFKATHQSILMQMHEDLVEHPF